MPNNIDYQDLYERIKTIIELESEVKKIPKLEFGDKKGVEFNNLISSLPTLSPTDLIEYQRFILKRIREETRDYVEEKLDRIKKSYSDSISSMIEDVLEEL